MFRDCGLMLEDEKINPLPCPQFAARVSMWYGMIWYHISPMPNLILLPSYRTVLYALLLYNKVVHIAIDTFRFKPL